MHDILFDTVTSIISKEIDVKLEIVNCLFEVEKYLQKSVNLNIVRQNGKDIIQNQSLKARLTTTKYKKHCSNVLWCGMNFCFRTILGYLKRKPHAHYNVWFVASLMFFPLFIITSHTGSILAAWLTEPEKTTSLTILVAGIILFLFIITKALYMVGKN